MSDISIREQGYQYFLTEAPELLQTIELELLNLREDYSLVKVHSLMRTTHTLKGAAANVGLETIKTIAHHLEDVFKALYNPELVIDTDLEMLLFEGYECLRLPLMAEITGSYVDDSEALDRAVAVFAQLQEKLGDYFGREAQIPTSVELGFDITKSIFEVGVKQRLEALAEIVNSSSPSELEAALREQTEIFIGLGESLNLPGFGAIAQKTLTALDIHPQEVITITQVALTDFWQGWAQVMAGDRTCGGQPCFALQQLAGTILPASLSEQGSRSAGEQGGISQSPATDLEDAVEMSVDFSEASLEPSLDDIFGNFPSENEEIFVTESIEFVETIESEESSEESSINLSVNTASIQDVEASRATTISPVKPENYSEKIPQIPQSPVTNNSSPTTNSVKIPRSSVRVDLDLLERLSHLTGELLIGQNRQSNISEQLQESLAQIWFRLRRHQQTIGELRDWSDQMIIAQERQRLVEMKNWASDFDSLELDRYSEFHELLQTTLEEMVQLEEAIESTDYLARQSSQILEKQRRLLTNVQDDMRTARMLPLGEIFSRFPRLLQQLATTHNKQVELTLKGADVLIDRALAEKLYDPLLHLVRNAFDHGIEPASIRASRGKPETGKIEIHAYHRGNNTIIEVRDDGQGLDLDRIRRRAVELHFLGAEQASNASEETLLNLLFEPGFSTAYQVSELSGRGIGLNVVRSQMEALSGSVIVHSEPQQGATFLLQFPLTLTMAKLMICEAGGSVYALLSDAVEQILIPKSDQIKHSNGQKVLHLSKGSRGVVPVYNMADMLIGRWQIEDENAALNLPSKTSNLKSTPLLLLRQHSQTDIWQGAEFIGLEVDQIIGEQELVIRSLGKAIAPPNYVYGGSTLADGRLTLVIDPTALVDRAFDQLAGKLQITDLKWQIGEIRASLTKLSQPIRDISLNPALQNTAFSLPIPPSPPLPLPSSPAKILVVDDSISVRQTLAMTLQRAGYHVLQAQNGREALQQMQKNKGIQLVICDIEMPSMNGFEFLNHCRQNADLAKVPVLILTSRTSEKHRLIAKELGAVGYFTKPYRESEILSAIADLLNSKIPALVNS